MGVTNRHLTDAGLIKAALMTQPSASATENWELIHTTVTVAATSAATATPVISAAQIGAGRSFYLLGYLFRVNGTTVWDTAATFKIQDTNGTPVDFVTVAAVTTTFASQARVGPWTAGQTLEDAFSLGTGGTAAKGLQMIASAAQTAGSPLSLTVWGIAK